MAMVAGGPGRRHQQARLTRETRNRGGRGRWPRWLGRRRDYQGEREMDWRHKVGRGARAQVPAGKNDHGDSERGGQGSGRWPRVQVPAEKRRWRAHKPARLHSCSKFTTSGSYYSNILNIVPYMWRHSL